MEANDFIQLVKKIKQLDDYKGANLLIELYSKAKLEAIASLATE